LHRDERNAKYVTGELRDKLDDRRPLKYSLFTWSCLVKAMFVVYVMCSLNQLISFLAGFLLPPTLQLLRELPTSRILKGDLNHQWQTD
jgi:hypothetical protein